MGIFQTQSRENIGPNSQRAGETDRGARIAPQTRVQREGREAGQKTQATATPEESSLSPARLASCGNSCNVEQRGPPYFSTAFTAPVVGSGGPLGQTSGQPPFWAIPAIQELRPLPPIRPHFLGQSPGDLVRAGPAPWRCQQLVVSRASSSRSLF